ncbi:MAG: GntR family transcriptional regulator [Streptosporangiales bacterium]
MRQPWELVADALRHAMVSGTYRPGDQLPSENELAAQHDASRPTVRRALQDLRLRGLIETRQGKGAFVRVPTPLAITLTAANYNRHQREGRQGFAAQMQEQGHTSHQDIVEVTTVAAPWGIAQRLGLDEGARVVVRKLLFVVDDIPVQLVGVYYDPSLVAGSQLERAVPIPDGVHAELSRLGVHVTRLVEDFMGARLPTPDEQEPLQLPGGVPVTRNVRTAYAGNTPVEVMDTLSHGEVISYRLEVDLSAPVDHNGQT